MAKSYTAHELNTLSKESMAAIILSMQYQPKQMNVNMERLIEHFPDICRIKTK